MKKLVLSALIMGLVIGFSISAYDYKVYNETSEDIMVQITVSLNWPGLEKSLPYQTIAPQSYKEFKGVSGRCISGSAIVVNGTTATFASSKDIAIGAVFAGVGSAVVAATDYCGDKTIGITSNNGKYSWYIK